jgi:long-chain alkane monooxygenase
MHQRRQISLNAFYANTPGQNWIGLWSHPHSNAADYTSLDYWIDLARLAERGLFDSIFFADIYGVYDVFESSPRAAIQHAAMVPMNDPMLVIPSMAHATKHLGFGVTGNLTYEPPYILARRFSTLDHLTKGRIGWNIVTGFQQSGARAMGLDVLRERDTRYDAADDYMEAVYKLWEASWDDDAVVLDAATRTYARPDRVRSVTHEGPYVRMSGIHMCQPSPQRTPVLYQAGGSPRGRDFAARHAECIFLQGLPKEKTAENVRAIRRRAAEEGRDPDNLRFIVMATIIVAPTDAEARDKHAELERYVDPEGLLALYSGLSGFDLSRGIGAATSHQEGSAAVVEGFTAANHRRIAAARELANFGAQGGRECFLVGSPVTVADALESWMDEAEIDGFNLQRAGEPEHLASVIDLLVPELQNRGRYKTAYTPGSFRDKLFGIGARLPSGHPAARHRPGR